MKKNKWMIVGAIAIFIGLSSCGIFHKSCNCPHFGSVRPGGVGQSVRYKA
jgi:hypothetical protein